MSALTDTFTLSNGVEIPKIGFGTWQIPDAEAYRAVSDALEVGYRHIDTARAYRNESGVGRAIRESGLSRADVFVTTKLPAEVKDHDRALRTFDDSLEALGLDTVDLWLIHAPWPWNDMGSDHRDGNAAAWRAMTEVYESGRARSIGVSNFMQDDIDALMTGSDTLPLVNQFRSFVGHLQPDLVAYCQGRGIQVEGYSPLATGDLLDSDELAEIADRYDATVAQLSIRYLLQHDVLPLPKTTHRDRMVENAQVDFVISDDDMAALDALDDPTDGDHPL